MTDELLTAEGVYELQNILSVDNKVVVEFGAAWCGPCKKFLPHFEEFAARNLDITCVKVDVDTDPAFLSEYKIQSVPQVMLFENGEYVRHITGRTVLALEREI